MSPIFQLLDIDPYLYKRDLDIFLVMYRSVYEDKLLYAYHYLREAHITDSNYYNDILNFVRTPTEQEIVDTIEEIRGEIFFNRELAAAGNRELAAGFDYLYQLLKEIKIGEDVIKVINERFRN